MEALIITPRLWHVAIVSTKIMEKIYYLKSIFESLDLHYSDVENHYAEPSTKIKNITIMNL